MSELEMSSKRHNIILEDRSRLSMSGVTDVESFDENEVSLFTILGELVIREKVCTSIR